MTQQQSPIEVVGEFKWFNAQKGYGFIKSEEIGDILLHSAVIKLTHPEWQIPTIGTRMKVEAAKVSKGWRAVKLIDPLYAD